MAQKQTTKRLVGRKSKERVPRNLNVSPYLVGNENERRSNVDAGPRGNGRREQLSCGWLVETTSAWLKQTAPLGRVKLRNLHKVDWLFVFGCAGHNLMSPPKLIAIGAHNVRGLLRIKKKVAASKEKPQARR